MPRFAANLTMLFNELPFRARFSAARMAGFRAVEFLFPYEHEPGLLVAEIEANALQVVLFNLPPGDWAAGERGLAAIPGREAQFETAMTAALDYAEMLGCRTLHAMAGVLSPAIDPDRAMATYIGNLRRGAEEARGRGVSLVIEPINSRDMPGYFLNRTGDARRVIEAVAADNLGLQLDLYHRQVMEGGLARAIRDNADITRHIQVANPPDRADPAHGEINYPYLFGLIDETGFDGWVGCEYRPLGATKDSLAWFAPYR